MAGFNPTFTGVGDNRLDYMGAIPIAIFDMLFTGTDTYLTGGIALTSANFGLSRPICAVEVMGANTASPGWIWSWNTQTNKLQAFQSTTGAPAALVEVNNTNTGLQNASLRLIVTAQR